MGFLRFHTERVINVQIYIGSETTSRASSILSIERY